MVIENNEKNLLTKLELMMSSFVALRTFVLLSLMRAPCAVQLMN